MGATNVRLVISSLQHPPHPTNKAMNWPTNSEALKRRDSLAIWSVPARPQTPLGEKACRSTRIGPFSCEAACHLGNAGVEVGGLN